MSTTFISPVIHTNHNSKWAWLWEVGERLWKCSKGATGCAVIIFCSSWVDASYSSFWRPYFRDPLVRHCTLHIVSKKDIEIMKNVNFVWVCVWYVHLSQKVIIAVNTINHHIIIQRGAVVWLLSSIHLQSACEVWLMTLLLCCRTITYAGHGTGTGSLPSYSMHERTSAAFLFHSVHLAAETHTFVCAQGTV